MQKAGPGTRTISMPWTFFWTKYDYIQVRSRLSPLALKRTWERRLTATRRHSAQIKLQELERAEIFKAGTPLTDALLVLYTQWSRGTTQTPTLFDAVVVAYASHPELCPTEPMRLRVDDQGYTRVESGAPNAQVCLRSSSDQFLEFFMPRIVAPRSAW